MTGRKYVMLVAVCAVWLGFRAVTQPAGFDFDEPAHVGTVTQIRAFGGLAPADLFPEIIVNPQTIEPRFHMFPPLPYVLMAAATAVAQTDQSEVAAVRFKAIHGESIADAASIDPVATTVLLVSRAFSAFMALIAVISAGLAVRNLQRAGSTWTVPAAVTVGMALMPGVHSMGASVTASTWALAAVGVTCAATAWAVRSNWSRGATAVVVGAAVFVVAVRASAYPVLLLIPLAMLVSRVTLRAAILRLSLVAAAVVMVNGWWIVRNALVHGDPLGANIYLSTVADVAACNIARESQVWCAAASGPWPAWTLLTSTDIFWVYLSRMLVRRTWIDTLTMVIWVGMVVLPAVLVVANRIRCRVRRPQCSFALLTAASSAGLAMLAFVLAVTLAGRIGWSIYARDTFIALTPLVVAVAALADLRHDRLRTLCLGSGLAFAAAANAGFMLAVLP